MCILFNFTKELSQFNTFVFILPHSGNTKSDHVKELKWEIIYGWHGISWNAFAKISVSKSPWTLNQSQETGTELVVMPTSGIILIF